jgi:hypothetical protein
MTTTRTSSEMRLEHPYLGAGIVVIVLSLALVALDLGVLARCGGGGKVGVCFDPATHGLSDVALVAFFILFIIGLMMVMYTGASETVTSETQRTSPPPAPTVVVASASPPATTVNVTPAPAASAPTVNVNSPPRAS